MIGVELLIKEKFGVKLGLCYSTKDNKEFVATNVVTSRWNAGAQLQEDLIDPEVIYRDLRFSSDVHRCYSIPLSQFKIHFNYGNPGI